MKSLQWTMVPVLIAACCGMASPSFGQGEPETPAALAIGSPAPLKDTAMKRVGGRPLSIAGAAGKKGTLVLFICNHCPWVKAWQSRIAAIGNAAPSQGVGVIAINSNDPAAYPEDDFATMQSNAKKSKMGFPYAVDGTSDVARAFGATRTPEAFLFDAKGLLVYHGAIDDNAHQPDQVKVHYLEEAVNALLDGKEITLAETKALGCGIKLRTSKT